MTSSVSVSIDVPNLEAGIEFYSAAFGFAKKSVPVQGVAVLEGLNIELCLLEKTAGTKPAINSVETRRYSRHWTPVHLDIHVGNLQEALTRALKAGAVKEQVFENSEHGSAAFCSDPFGHGFCLIQRRK